MKQSTSFTFNLLKALNVAEKSYVKKQISSSGLHLMQLFDDLNKCDFYQKQTFIERYPDKKYIKNLSQNKIYLGKKIVEALISYRSKSIYNIEIHNQINEALILIEKKFYKRAKKIIDRSFQKALHFEDYAKCYFLIDLIFEAINNHIYFGLSKEEINAYRTKRRFHIIQINRIDTFDELNEIYYNIPESEQLPVYKKKLTELDLWNSNELSKEYPFKAKRIFYFTKAHIAWLTKKQNEYRAFSKKMIHLYILNDQFIAHHFTSFLGDATNFLNSLIEVKDFKTFLVEHQKIIDLLKAHQKKAFCIDNSLIHVINYYFPQIVYNDGKYFKESLEFSKSYAVFLEKQKNQLSNHFKALSSIEIALANLYNHRYAKALEYLDEVLNDKNYANQYTARIIQLLAHHLSGDDLLLEHLFRSFLNYLKSNGKMEQSVNIRKLWEHVKTNSVFKLNNKDFENFVNIHWYLFK